MELSGPSPSIVPAVVPASGRYIINDNDTSTATVTGAANRMEISPWRPAYDLLIDKIGINVTTGHNSNAKIVIYDSDEQGRPRNLIHESADLDCTSIAPLDANLSYRFQRGRQYWLGVRWAGTPTLSANSVSSATVLSCGTTIGTTRYYCLRRSLTYATAAPSTWTYDATEEAASNPVTVFLRPA